MSQEVDARSSEVTLREFDMQLVSLPLSLHESNMREVFVGRLALVQHVVD
jgi:hypothetical protein